MKIKDVEMIRVAELLFLVCGSAWASCPTSEMVQDLLSSPDNINFFVNTMQSISEKRDLFPNKDIMVLLSAAPMYADLLFFGNKLDSKTEEYKKLDKLYNQVLDNTSDLMKDFYLDSPIAIFAMYVYLYRNGYLSQNHQFKYSLKLKDMPKLCGADLMTGNGVCRSIAAFLSDLYTKMGYDSETLAVNATSQSCKNLERLCPTPLLKEDNTSKIVKVATLATSIVKTSNHLITRVNSDGYNYVLDPTNDGILYPDGKKLIIEGHDKISMLYRPMATSFNRASGQIKGNALLKGLNEKMQLPSIDVETYRKIYLETLELCKCNPDILESFYQESVQLYDEMTSILEKQRGLLGRKLPIMPKVKVK